MSVCERWREIENMFVGLVVSGTHISSLIGETFVDLGGRDFQWT